MSAFWYVLFTFCQGARTHVHKTHKIHYTTLPCQFLLSKKKNYVYFTIGADPVKATSSRKLIHKRKVHKNNGHTIQYVRTLACRALMWRVTTAMYDTATKKVVEVRTYNISNLWQKHLSRSKEISDNSHSLKEHKYNYIHTVWIRSKGQRICIKLWL